MRKLSRITESWNLAIETFANCGETTKMRGQETTNEIQLIIGANEMSKLESYKVVTVDRGYHVYVAVWEAAFGQILPCKREGGNIHAIPSLSSFMSLSRKMTRPLIITPPYSMKIF